MGTTFQPFKEEHNIFRQQVRTFAENELAPKVDHVQTPQGDPADLPAAQHLHYSDELDKL